MVGGGGGGWRNAAKRMWRAAFGWEADANAEADGTRAAARGGHHNTDTGAVSNGSSPPRKKARGDDGSDASEALVGPEGHAPSPSAAVGGPASSLPATFPSAGFAGNAAAAEVRRFSTMHQMDTSVEANAAAAAGMTEAVMRNRIHLDAHRKKTLSVIKDQRAMIEALTQRTCRLEGLLLAARVKTAQDPAANAVAAAAEAVVRARHGFGHAGILNDQHATIEALTQRTNRLEKLLAEVETPQAASNYKFGVAADYDAFELRLDALTQQMVEHRALLENLGLIVPPPPTALS